MLVFKFNFNFIIKLTISELVVMEEDMVALIAN